MTKLSNLLSMALFLYALATASGGGLVLDSEGKPAGGAYIHISGADSKNLDYMANIKSDAEGRFSLPVLQEGAYELEPWDDSRGVPNTVIAVLHPLNTHAVTVHVPPSGITKEVKLELPAPFGLLTVVVEDAKDHKEMANATITLTQTGKEDIYLITHLHERNKFVRRVPRRPLSVTVSVPGYLPWSSDSAGGILVGSGQTLNLEALMVRSPVK